MKSHVPTWIAQALEQRAKHEPNCSWSSEMCMCSCGLFELRLHLVNAMEDDRLSHETSERLCACDQSHEDCLTGIANNLGCCCTSCIHPVSGMTPESAMEALQMRAQSERGGT